MNAKALIRKKRDGGELSTEEIRFLAIEGAAERIPDYQLTALLMAIFFNSMSSRETADLARAMLESGEQLDFGDLAFLPTDKHSTGGVGDKISFLVAPLVAAAGVPVPMISGRSLGHTGGTLDKLESIPGFRTELTADEMRRQIGRIGLFICGQTQKLAPADRKFYSLRDAASIVESIPLIVGSILSKKAAAGVRALVLDVKVGTGAFMPTVDRGRELASALVAVAKQLDIRARAHLTPMNCVLGRTAGNALEIRESIEALAGRNVSPDLRDLTLCLAGSMLELSGAAASVDAGRDRIAEVWRSGAGLERFLALVEAQGGDPRILDHPELLSAAGQVVEVTSARSGYLLGFEARGVGDWITESGGGRLVSRVRLDHSVGTEALASRGAAVRVGDPILRVHAPASFDPAVLRIRASSWIRIQGEPVSPFASGFATIDP